jgi:hypothetical protein
MKKIMRLLMLSSAALLFTACGGGGSSDTPDAPEITSIEISVDSVDYSNNTGMILISVDASDYTSSTIYDYQKIIELYSGTIENGYIKLESGKHLIKVCLTNAGGETCSESKPIYITKNISLDEYVRYPLENKSTGLSNDGNEILYGTLNGQIYALNTNTEKSDWKVSTGNSMINGLAYISDTTLLYSGAYTMLINKINLNTGETKNITSLPFPDGLDFFNNKIYSVTNDASGIVTIFNLNGTKEGELDTGIDDITGISHTDKYLYILSEDGHIYQTDPSSGHSNRIFVNNNLFEMGNNNNGLEAITVLNNKIYVSYINDSMLYLIDIDLDLYE